MKNPYDTTTYEDYVGDCRRTYLTGIVQKIVLYLEEKGIEHKAELIIQCGKGISDIFLMNVPITVYTGLLKPYLDRMAAKYQVALYSPPPHTGMGKFVNYTLHVDIRNTPHEVVMKELER